MGSSRLLAAGVLAAVCGSVQATTAASLHDELTALAKDVTYTTATLFTTRATVLGIPGHDGELDAPSEANRNAYIGQPSTEVRVAANY